LAGAAAEDEPDGQAMWVPERWVMMAGPFGADSVDAAAEVVWVQMLQVCQLS
jgi:hypothetical protein